MKSSRLVDLGEIHSTSLHARRRVQVWTPPATSVRESAVLPVVLLHDGQNLFRPEESFLGVTWNVPATMDSLAHRGLPALAVGVWNGGRHRLLEYSPPGALGGSGRAEAHLDFLEHEVLAEVAKRFPISNRAEDTALVGSSLGGLVSLWGFLSRPHRFGLCAALSPSLGFGGRSLHQLARTSSLPASARLYLDVGTREISRRRKHVWSPRSPSQHYADLVRHIAKILERRGLRRGIQWVVVKDVGGRHTERDWARRLPLALAFLLGGVVPPRTVRARPKRSR